MHFDFDLISPYEIGYKAGIVNFSDMAAMAAQPFGMTVGLAIPEDTRLSVIEELYEGLRRSCADYQVSILGGDVITAQNLLISITVWGPSPHNITRGGAKPGQLIGITGYPGRASAGLDLLKNKPLGWDRPGFKNLVEAWAKPRAKVKEGSALAGIGISSLIDVSDGLAGDLRHICEMSDVGAVIDLRELPVEPVLKEAADLLGTDPLGYILSGGEDYELLFTIPDSASERLSDLDFECRIIGKTMEDASVRKMINADGREIDLPFGYTHFKT